MSATRKLSAEEELEKQYQEYKAQFLQWKERNRDSEGTDAYIRYVRQFQDWERDVERRRAVVKQKAERERQAVAEKEAAARREADAQRKRDEEAAAKAYAEQQSQYLAMHQRAMQEEQKARVGGAAPLTIQFHSAPLVGSVPSGASAVASAGRSPQPLAGNQQQGQNAAPGSNDVNPMFNVMQQMLSFVMKAENKGKNGDIGGGDKPQSSLLFPSAVPPPVDSSSLQQSSSAGEAGQQRPSAPQLWGNEGASYLVTDPMFRRWNVRAAPPNFRVPYQPPPEGTPIVPGWLTQRRMNEEQLVFAHKGTIPGPAGAGSIGGGALPQSITALPPPATSSAYAVPPPNFAQPPPLFKI